MQEQESKERLRDIEGLIVSLWDVTTLLSRIVVSLESAIEECNPVHYLASQQEHQKHLLKTVDTSVQEVNKSVELLREKLRNQG